MGWADDMAFGTSGLDRAAHLRGHPDRIAGLLPQASMLPVWRGKPLMQDGAGLGWLHGGHPVLEMAGPPVFLGLDDGVPRFAADISDWAPGPGSDAPQSGFFDTSEQHHPDLPVTQRFCELRGAMLRLSAREGELAASARAVLQWHGSHRFCSACGAPSESAQAGWQRRCAACGTSHFPRTDPVVIMLILRGNDLLLGRSPGWPAGMYSCLAGFVEPGETIEAAVRREVAEETGVAVSTVRYVASQPWPFPTSLMIGCRGQAVSGAITIDPAELEDARWVSREEMVTVMDGRHAEIKPTRRGAIAHALIAEWLADRVD